LGKTHKGWRIETETGSACFQKKQQKLSECEVRLEKAVQLPETSGLIDYIGKRGGGSCSRRQRRRSRRKTPVVKSCLEGRCQGVGNQGLSQRRAKPFTQTFPINGFKLRRVPWGGGTCGDVLKEDLLGRILRVKRTNNVCKPKPAWQGGMDFFLKHDEG